MAFADIDDDGDQDIYHELGGFYPGDGYANALLENPGHGGHFAKLTLQGVTSNRDAVGARIRVTVRTPAGVREIHRAAGSVSSFGGSPKRQEIGLGDAEAIESLEIRWPAGSTQRFTEVPMDCALRAVEGQPELTVEELTAIELGAGGSAAASAR